MSEMFPNLFSPLTINNVTLKNRIFSTGHMTTLVTGYKPNEELAAYHESRARGGAGLVIIEVALVHESAVYTSHTIAAYNDDCIPGYQRIAQAVHRHGCKAFGQLFHPGRENFDSIDGSAPLAYAPSAVPNERFHVMPRAMPRSLVRDVVEGYGDSALRLKQGGLDGVEIVASHGYLPAQFLNPNVNLREDEYGGSLENRVRFLREITDNIRAKVGEDFVVGLRISGDEQSHDQPDIETVTAAIEMLDQGGGLDYFNVIAGSSSSLGGSVHIVPPMFIETGYVAPYAATVKHKTSVPVFVAGRINQPQQAEEIVASGQADMIGMTRAQICDPAMAGKAEAGRVDDIRACIGCNQACIGHMHMGVGISCIQHPESGRELIFGERKPLVQKKKVLVAGGGPGGMKAAAVAAERGHDVTLYEASGQLGGQTLLAQALPGRAEFGGIVTNLTREMELGGVRVVKNTAVTRELVESEAPDTVIIATGATPASVELEGAEEAHVVEAWSVVKGEANVGGNVVIADWRCDWIGMGLAEHLARNGCNVTLAVDGYMPGQMIQMYVRDHWAATLHKLGVKVIPYARVFGADADSVYLQHVTSGEAIIVEEVDTLVTALGHHSVTTLADALEDWSGEVHMVGDCLSPRTAEEAVLEGLKVSSEL
ncbi:MAG: FAD-dependent oxidoreductase [Rhodospirillaceae bacterium]|jgi:2,4-dienoyl-CoA reductase-like NADH-dependent reductase (Old Yellow Enzyme family)/thioredoxin reductase|nr:FAD-dependent oxidoreductase [Rhodospirillaceae bacterium]MBT7648582.1 FAD-dependent oxidoreductase [Rhodospirillaceae bacterium]